ncbi:hypothetical protein V865_005534 [Kwoniella europaea PYCC6329]|uniref:Uncharacterized protein n=1 Tax=Kwoniella europaea PYCC6329 TaxID=1423913 RepID=A0AAX4KP97_9TREE
MAPIRRSSTSGVVQPIGSRTRSKTNHPSSSSIFQDEPLTKRVRSKMTGVMDPKSTAEGNTSRSNASSSVSEGKKRGSNSNEITGPVRRSNRLSLQKSEVDQEKDQCETEGNHFKKFTRSLTTPSLPSKRTWVGPTRTQDKREYPDLEESSDSDTSSSSSSHIPSSTSYRPTKKKETKPSITSSSTCQSKVKKGKRDKNDHLPETNATIEINSEASRVPLRPIKDDISSFSFSLSNASISDQIIVTPLHARAIDHEDWKSSSQSSSARFPSIQLTQSDLAAIEAIEFQNFKRDEQDAQADAFPARSKDEDDHFDWADDGSDLTSLSQYGDCEVECYDHHGEYEEDEGMNDDWDRADVSGEEEGIIPFVNTIDVDLEPKVFTVHYGFGEKDLAGTLPPHIEEGIDEDAEPQFKNDMSEEEVVDGSVAEEDGKKTMEVDLIVEEDQKEALDEQDEEDKENRPIRAGFEADGTARLEHVSSEWKGPAPAQEDQGSLENRSGAAVDDLVGDKRAQEGGVTSHEWLSQDLELQGNTKLKQVDIKKEAMEKEPVTFLWKPSSRTMIYYEPQKQEHKGIAQGSRTALKYAEPEGFKTRQSSLEPSTTPPLETSQEKLRLVDTFPRPESTETIELSSDSGSDPMRLTSNLPSIPPEAPRIRSRSDPQVEILLIDSNSNPTSTPSPPQMEGTPLIVRFPVPKIPKSELPPVSTKPSGKGSRGGAARGRSITEGPTRGRGAGRGRGRGRGRKRSKSIKVPSLTITSPEGTTSPIPVQAENRQVFSAVEEPSCNFWNRPGSAASNQPRTIYDAQPHQSEDTPNLHLLADVALALNELDNRNQKSPGSGSARYWATVMGVTPQSTKLDILAVVSKNIDNLPRFGFDRDGQPLNASPSIIASREIGMSSDRHPPKRPRPPQKSVTFARHNTFAAVPSDRSRPIVRLPTSAVRDEPRV